MSVSYQLYPDGSWSVTDPSPLSGPATSRQRLRRHAMCYNARLYVPLTLTAWMALVMLLVGAASWAVGEGLTFDHTKGPLVTVVTVMFVIAVPVVHGLIERWRPPELPVTRGVSTARLRVVRVDGRPVTPLDAAVRSVLRMLLWPASLAVALATWRGARPLPHDLLSRTRVVVEPVPPPGC